MPAPTALRASPAQASLADPLTDVNHILQDAEPLLISQPQPGSDAQCSPLASHTTAVDQKMDDAISPDQDSSTPRFKAAIARSVRAKMETRKVPIPPHRMTPLKASWPKIYPPLVEHLKLQVRMNIKLRAVELRTSRHTPAMEAGSALQKGEDFVRAFALGFDVDDAIALLRLDDLYIETFEVRDVKSLDGDHLSRAVGRIAGKDGRIKFSIENATRTRIVLANQKIHILGGFRNVRAARESVVSLILGHPPGKVYGNLRVISAKMKESW